MAELYGREYSRAELERFTGRLDQVAGIVPLELAEGFSRGVRALAVTTGSGFAFTAIADRALDVASATFEGIPLCWRSCNAIAASAYYDPQGAAWLRTFFGGLFTTCGLTNSGPAGSDRYGTFGLHGRINAVPAEAVSYETRWQGSDCVFDVRGTMRETTIFGEELQMERLLRTRLGSNRLELHDLVTNVGSKRTPHMILYHCNGGFPILDEAGRLYVSQRGVSPRDAEAAKGLAEWDRGGLPDATFAEQVFVHEPIACADGRAAVVLDNPALRDGRGLALAIRFDLSQLPAFFSWRMLGAGTYVMGMEPGNCPTVDGRVEAEKRGTLPFLEPGETRQYDLEFEVVDRVPTREALLSSVAVAGGPGS